MAREYRWRRLAVRGNKFVLGMSNDEPHELAIEASFSTVPGQTGEEYYAIIQGVSATFGPGITEPKRFVKEVWHGQMLPEHASCVANVTIEYRMEFDAKQFPLEPMKLEFELDPKTMEFVTSIGFHDLVLIQTETAERSIYSDGSEFPGYTSEKRIDVGNDISAIIVLDASSGPKIKSISGFPDIEGAEYDMSIRFKTESIPGESTFVGRDDKDFVNDIM